MRPTDGTRRSTGIDTLDAVLGGLRPADLVILGARPSMGKTALALHIALEVAASGGLVGIFSMEMSREALAHRALAHESGIAVHDIRGGNLGNHAAREVVAAAGRFGTLPLWIDDAVGLTVDAMAARVRRLAAMTGHEPALLVVDYLQLARAPVGRADNRERVVAEVSMGLKAIARAHRCTVLALAQLNRDATKRADNRPQVSDLRDSGQIEQDADAILLLHRPVVLDPNHPDPGEAELAVAKQRQGPTGVVMLRFDGRAQSFRADTVTREASPRPSAKPRSRGEDPYA